MKIHFHAIDTMLFDYEGTLVDFQWNLYAAVQETLEMLQSLGFNKNRIKSRKYSTLINEAMEAATEIGLEPVQVKEQIGLVYDRFDEDALTRWSLRPYVKDFLLTIKARGIQTGLVSNVGGKTLRKALPELGLAGLFDITLSRNEVLNLKPNPDGLNLAMEKLRTKKDKSIFMGDSLDDINAARNAGLKVIIITEGENIKEDIISAKPDYIIKGYDELLSVL